MKQVIRASQPHEGYYNMKRSMISLLSIIPLTMAACGGSSGGGAGGGGSAGDCTPSGGTNTAQYVANTVTVPATPGDDAIDMDGDGKPDNELGLIIQTLNQQMLMIQQGVTDALTMGQFVVLASETSTDATFQTDSCAKVELVEGQSTSSPDFSGNGTFSIATMTDAGAPITPGIFDGAIKGGKFASASPVTTKNPVAMSLSLPLVSGAPALSLNVNAARVTFTRNAAGSVTGGQLNGVIKNSDVQSELVPGVAKILTAKIQSGATDSTTMQISTLFDTGGTKDPTGKCGATCQNPDGTCAVAMDHKIDTCEVSSSMLVQSLLSPDVQMYDSAGNYHPTPGSKSPDSLSLGLAFSLVGAKF